MTIEMLIYALFCFMIGFTIAKSRNIYSLVFLSLVLMAMVKDPSTLEFVKINYVFYAITSVILVCAGIYTAVKTSDHWTF